MNRCLTGRTEPSDAKGKGLAMFIGRTIGAGECAIIIGLIVVVVLITMISIRARKD